MKDYSESHSEDEIYRLARLAKQLAEREIAPMENTVVAGWRMGAPALDPGQELRAQIWESIKDFPEECFPIRLPWLEGTTLEFHHPNETGRQLYVNRSFDPNDLAVLAHFLKPGATFVDVGANAGLYSVYAAKKVGHSGRVFAFEPSRREAASLNMNADINRLTNLRCFQMAAGAADGKATLSIAEPEHDGHNSLNGLAVASVFPNIRYSTDGEDFHWTSFAGPNTRIEVGQAGQLELAIYSESEFDFILDDIRIYPEEAVAEPWHLVGPGEKVATMPRHVKSSFSNSSVTQFRDARVRSAGSALRIESVSGGGIVFRWKLDPAQDSSIILKGQPRVDSAREEYEVEVVAVDSLFTQSGMPKVDVIKIDVEGFEIEVLKGAAKVIAAHQPLILIEVVNALLENKQTSAAEIGAILQENGYTCFDAANGKPRLVDLMSEHSSNVFAVPERFLDQMLKLGGLDRQALTAGQELAEQVQESPA